MGKRDAERPVSFDAQGCLIDLCFSKHLDCLACAALDISEGVCTHSQTAHGSCDHGDRNTAATTGYAGIDEPVTDKADVLALPDPQRIPRCQTTHAFEQIVCNHRLRVRR